MKRMLSITLVVILCLSLFVGCKTQPENKEVEEVTANVIKPLPETVDVNNLGDCTVAISLEKGNAYVDDSGKMVMKLKVYSYEIYDMTDIASLKENDVIVRRNEEVNIATIERLDTGLVRINGGEENGGFDLISNDNTVYYEIGMSDMKNYYELGEVTLPVSDEFEYVDQSNPDDEKVYYPGDFLTDAENIEYNFNPNNTTVIVEDGVVVKMNKVYMP